MQRGGAGAGRGDNPNVRTNQMSDVTFDNSLMELVKTVENKNYKNYSKKDKPLPRNTSDVGLW